MLGAPHPLLGQGIIAVVSPAPDTQAKGSESMLEVQILQACTAALPAFMVPLHIAQRAQLPKTPNGKIDRTSLKQELQHLFN